MWYCKACKVSFTTESIEQHVYTNHLKPKVGQIKVYTCGECVFSAEGFDDIALHCINLQHEPTLVFKGLDYNGYEPQLFTALAKAMCLKKVSSLETKQQPTNTSSGIQMDHDETDRKAIDWSEPEEWTRHESAEKNGSGMIKNPELVKIEDDSDVEAEDAPCVEIKADNFNDQNFNEVDLTRNFEHASVETVRQLSATSLNSENFTALDSRVDQQDATNGFKPIKIENNHERITSKPIKEHSSSAHLSSDGENIFPSDYSPQKAFPDAMIGERHQPLLQTSSENPYQCGTCKNTCSCSGSLAQHQDIVHKDKKLHSCGFCGKSFLQRHKLQIHERVHTGERPFSCSTCGRSFRRSCVLKNHERTHSGEKPYSCKICRTSFAKPYTLKEHERVHSGEKPYSCTICTKSFAHRKTLILHERIHSGEKPYSCKICTTSFARSHALKEHERIHSGETPYSCTICMKSFTHRTSLIVHKQIHSGEKPYSCTICTKSFALRYTLKKHERTHSRKKTILMVNL